MKLSPLYYRLLFLLSILFLAGCASEESDNLVGTHMIQNPGQPAVVPSDVGDIAIAGTQVAQAIRNLPEILAAPKPPVIQFTQVTSIVIGKELVDTQPYTNLLRDRLVTGADNKVRYMERELPALHVSHKRKKEDISTEQSEISANPDYSLTAELQGNEDNKLYRIQIQLIDVRTSALVLNAVYKIRKEDSTLGAPGNGAFPRSEIAPPQGTPPTAVQPPPSL